jgi:hypothetical protein
LGKDDHLVAGLLQALASPARTSAA